MTTPARAASLTSCGLHLAVGYHLPTGTVHPVSTAPGLWRIAIHYEPGHVTVRHHATYTTHRAASAAALAYARAEWSSHR